MKMRSGRTTSASSQRPHEQESYDALTEPATPPPPELLPQVTASEALVMLASRESSSDTELLGVADSILDLSAPMFG